MRTTAKRRIAAAAITAFATAVTGVTVAAGASAAPATAPVPQSASLAPGTVARPSRLDTAALQQAITVHPGEAATGAVAFVQSDGQTWRGTSGDAHTGKPVPADAHFRIGSVSKTFEAVVLLQLAAEHRVDLDQSVQHYLPGLIPDPFQPITVRQLLAMTSGLPQIGQGGPGLSVDQLIAGRGEYQTFQQIIDSTLRPDGRAWPGPSFAPGTAQAYNSLNFRIIGLLIEHLTGHSFGDEVNARVIRPLHLTGTFVPQGNPRMPAPYLHGYLTDSQGAVTDVSAAGGDPSSMISTTRDLDRFITALFGGLLLPPARLADMVTLPRDSRGDLVPYVGDSDNCQTGADKGKACFGLGLTETTLPDGTVLWGKTGEDMGYFTVLFASRDLRHVGVVATSLTSLGTEAGLMNANRLAVAAFGS